MGTPPPPPSPPPNPGAGRLFGTNNLGGQLDALTRAFTTFTNRFASSAGMSNMGMRAFGPLTQAGNSDADRRGRLQQQYLQAQSAHNVARQRMQDDLERQQLQWDRQLRAGTRTMNNMRLPSWQRQEAQDRLDEQAILFNNAQGRTRRQWQLQENQFSGAMTQMNADRDRLARQTQTQTTMNRVAFGAQVAGTIVGAAKSYYSGNIEEQLGQFERRMSLMNPDFQGSHGTRARGFGRQMKSSGTMMWATGNEDLFGGETAIRMQSPMNQWGLQLNRASSAAFVTPGLGIQGAAQMQQEMGTAQAFYASQMFGLAPSRFAGGRQNSSTAVALSLAQRVNNNQFGNLTGSQLQAQFAQGGSLSMSMANYARTAGLSGQSVEAMRNQTELMRDLMNPSKGELKKLTSDQALKTIENAGRRDAEGDKARDQIKKYAPSIGDSYQDSQRYLQGLSREGHLPASASFLDAAKASANTLADIHSLLQKTLEPLADVIGKVAGSAKGGGFWGSAGTGVKSGWNSGPNVFFGDWGEGTDQGSWAKSTWSWAKGLFGGDRGTPESKQGKKAQKAQKAEKSASGAGIGAAISFAREQLGDKYLLGADGPDVWDCSSLMQAAFKSAGVNLPRTTYDQINKGKEVPIDEVQPGDLVFYKDVSHVGLYTGGGNVLEAANPGKGVVEGKMYSKFTRARRIMSGGMAAVENLSEKDKEKEPAAGAGAGIGGGGFAGGYGSVEEVDALASALAGGGGAGSVQSVSRAPKSSQNEEAEGADESPSKPAPKNVQANVALGKKMAADFGWTGKNWDSLYNLWMRESGWRHWADNPSSDAYGIPQAMSNIHKETATEEWRNSPAKQIAWGLNYIKRRYTTPAKAWSHWQSRVPLGGKDVGHWYDVGAWNIPDDQDARLHKGEMVLNRNDAQTVRQALLNQGLNPAPGQGSSSGGGGQVTLQFDAGSVVISMPAATVEGAKTAATAFVSHVAADDRIKSLMGGW
jgi:cell wall-associated NlpC family hydrolase